MTLSRLLTCSLCLTAAIASAEEYWASGVNESGGWYDVSKTIEEDVDDDMCYAASASNLIAWWQKGRTESRLSLPSGVPTAADAIWGQYKKAAEPIWEEQKSLLEENEKLDLGGITIGAINWWISGIYLPTTKEEETRNVFSYEEAEENTITLESFSGYYYDAYSLTRDHLENFFEMYAFADEDEDTRLYTGVFADLLDAGAGVSLGLHSDDEELAHAVTLWGAEYMENRLSKIWITDSDDNEGLLEIEVSVKESAEGDKIYLVDYANGYEGIYIEQVYAISPSEAKAWGIPEPSYTILPLITLLGVLIRRRRK